MHTEPILDIAKKETSPEYRAQFTPITRGPLFALAALLPLALVAIPILIYKKLFSDNSHA